MDPILEYARVHRLSVVEDAAHSLPTTYKGNLVGTLGSDATVFSFYATKTMTTGEGGMVVTGSSDLAARCRTMRLHGISRDAFDRYTARTPSWYYEVVAPGFKYNLTDIASAIGIQQLRRVRGMRDRRAAIADRYTAGLAGLPLQLPADAPRGDTHAWHLYVLRLTDEAPLGRDAFIAAMARAGIGCSVHFIPLHLQPYWRDRYSLDRASFPAATAAYAGAVSLPIYTRMTDDDVDRVVATIRNLLSR
jgi:dTDP-4-amino-4,6-dideoxygalactose transaminase